MPRKKPTAAPKATGPALNTIEATLAKAPSVVGAIARFQLLTGLSPQQALLIRSTDLSRNTQPWQLSVAGETIELSAGTMKVLEPYAQRQGYLLSASRSGRAFCLEAYSNALRTAAERAGVRHWSPFALIHTRENLLDQLAAKAELTADGNCTAKSY